MKLFAYLVLFAIIGFVGYVIPSLVPSPWYLLVCAAFGGTMGFFGSRAIEAVL